MDEKEILKFWKENNIFEKTLKKDSPKGEFVFYDGPPFATGLPHYGSLLPTVAKDLFCRYKTMQGFHVRRRWGWDCHGLPIENMIEKRLGLKSKKDIEAMGVEKFNETCRSVVLETAGAWKEYIEKIGRWTEFDDAYMTMDSSFMESVWWALKQLWDKGLIYEGRKVLPYCPRCETPLAKAEVAMDNSYKTVTDEAVFIKFKIKAGQKIGDWATNDKTYILAWTTTPWTLPGNTALAVNEEVEYGLVKHGEEILILAKDRVVFCSSQHLSEKSSDLVASRLQTFLQDVATSPASEIKGKDLLNLEYKPLYEIPAVKNSGKKSHYVVSADFVNTEDGTGVVHIAPMHGEDDYNVGVRYDLPIIPILDSSGHFNNEASEFIKGFYLKKGEKYIKEDLEKRGILFSKNAHTHSYPHCHRCETPLYYSALSSWFINIQKVKNRLIQLNEKINWQPDYLKHGRFLNIVKDAPDWNISRNRYWASPLPIWKCQKCQKIEVIGSLEDLKNHTKKSGNKYFVMRHGEAKNNDKNIVSSKLENSHKYPLTEFGKEQVKVSAEKLTGQKIDLIFYSPFERTKETAFIVAEKIGLAKENRISDKRLMEVDGGIFDGKPIADYHAYFSSVLEKFTKATPEGESLNELKKRMGEFLYEVEKKHSGKNILIVSHEYPIWMMCSVANGLDEKESIKARGEKDDFIGNGEIIDLPFAPLPHNRDLTLDLHRPYIDEVDLSCSDCGGEAKRVPEVLDGWFESGAMPFAEYHYPFKNKEQFEKRFPGDFVVEYIAQTRTWFYYMHAIAGMLFGDIGFKNVISTGNILGNDGAKMSKSKGNFTDPMLNMDKFGSDALRYYLMSNPVMRAEDVCFSDLELKEIHSKVINILWNSFKFFYLYKQEYDGKTTARESDNVLDKWIFILLDNLIAEVSEGLDNYNTVKAGRPIKDFINNFSTWFVRRSRDRVKGDDEKDKQFALATMREVLNELSKVIAPFMPFMAEAIYRGVGQGIKESVHLEEWTSALLNEKIKNQNEKLMEEMEEVRRIVSLGLEARAKAGIKVRQPVASLKIKSQISNLKNKEELLKLIKDELNVKEALFDDKISGEVELDEIITPELKEEGELRELIRGLQDLRKKAGLAPSQKINLFVQAEIQAREFMEKFINEIKKSAGIEKLEFNAVIEDGQEISTDDFVIKTKIC